MNYCDTCHRRHWKAKIDPKTGLQVKHRNGNKVFLCIYCGKGQEEERGVLLAEPIRAGILYLDLEVSKSLVYTYGQRVPGEYINSDDLVQEQFIICWAASYIGRSEIWSECVPAKDAKKFTDEKIIKRLHALMMDADIIAGHNVTKFDVKHANTRFLKYGLAPVLGKKTLDTLTLARSKFKLFSNKLDFVEKWLGFEGKDKIVNEDWLNVLKGDEKTLKKVEKYCRGDVRQGKKVLEVLQPWSGKPSKFGAIKGVETLPTK